MTDLSHDPDFFALLTGSYARRLGESLVPAGADAAWLYAAAPFAVLAHDGGADPHFVYGNRAAQACFGYAWDELIGLPSRLSAEAPERAARQSLLDAVTRDGYSRGYRGLRIAKDGRRFWIDQAVVWQLDRDGTNMGQAATFSAWRDA
ncbi:MEKHLA domain-containing protein [Methylobacterium phyllosphaerae]|uniref:MEKHLA domain-containing protein n=1 Tax=Methylobacterium phyllosphaerae TaxID=418223 RepID=A0AAE8HPM4_9HYPH|nr:MEKHLA domain-containing protein [Methylobacterium phyllosphaerae]APT33279.1 MEKHLA domain-containing protein [Methylobacterium phyllosphaerae]SFG56361.1 PAS domain S-box-containing protein [Methylobacterium phyllosphaerae]